MNLTNLARIDLNLLVVFQAVADARSVTSAADHLCLSQPAVSHALARLRRLLDDPLFTRGASGLRLTPRAAALIQPVAAILEAAGRLIANPEFDAAKTSRCFRAGTSDFASMTVVPVLVRKLNREAPLASFEAYPVEASTLDQLDRGDIDVAFWGAAPPDHPFVASELFVNRYAVIVDAAHPLAEKARSGGISLDDYLAFPHARIHFDVQVPRAVDAALARIGRERRVKAITCSFFSNLAALAGTELVATVPERVVEASAVAVLATIAPPFDLPLQPYWLVWHRRTTDEASLAWFRSLVAASV